MATPQDTDKDKPPPAKPQGGDDAKDWKDGGAEGLQDGDSGRELPEGLKRDRVAPDGGKAQERKG